MGLTDDPNVPHAQGPPDETPVPMAETYLVMSEEERAKGFVRPVRRSYIHVGIAGPTHELRDLTDEQRERYRDAGYVKFEEYPPNPDSNTIGRYWTQEQLASVGKGCGARITMAAAIAETYAREPRFYGSTYCVGCQMHRPVGADGEFIWDDGSGERVGT